VQRRAERPHVAERPGRPFQLLRGHVAGSAGPTARRIDRPGDPPVEHHHFAPLAEHDVRRLEIAVHDALLVGKRHRLGHPPQAVDEPVQRDAGGTGGPPALPGRAVDLGDGIGQCPAAHLGHREEQPTVGQAPGVVDRRDARVLQVGGEPGLFQQAAAGIRAVGALGLRCHLAREHLVAHPPHLGAPAAAQRRDQRVAGVHRDLGHRGRAGVERVRLHPGARRERRRDAHAQLAGRVVPRQDREDLVGETVGHPRP
jgi:hypothetical protein